MNNPDYLISTPENVDLHLELAGIGSRIWAGFIDITLVYIISLLIVLVAGLGAGFVEALVPIKDSKNMLFMYIIAVTVLLVFAINSGYFIIFEKLWQGQTPGKKVAQIRVIEANGQPLNWASAVIRNLVRIIDTGLFMIGLVVMVFDKNERRLGDMLGGTLVIRERQPDMSVRNLQIQAPPPATTFVDAGQITPDEYYLLVNFLRRRHQMNSASRVRLAKELEDYFRQKLNPENAGESSEFLLEKIYLSYTGRNDLEVAGS